MQYDLKKRFSMNYEQALLYKNDFLTYLHIEKNSAVNTYKSYQYDLNQLFHFWKKTEEEHKIEYAFEEVVDAFFMNLYETQMQKSSVARKVACFKSFEKYLQSCSIDIHLRLTVPRLEKKLPTYVTVEEITYLLDGVNDVQLNSSRPVRDKTVLELLYATGVRCSELCAITLPDINFDQKSILITGKGDKQRMVLFGDQAKTRMLSYIQGERAIDSIKKDLQSLFITQQGTPLQDRSVQRILQRFSILLSSKKQITPHKIRHSFATHLLNAGMNLRALQDLLGHSSLATTERYTHISAKDLKELYTNLNPLALMTLNHSDET